MARRLLLLALLVLAALAVGWWFASRDDRVEAKPVQNVVGLQQDEGPSVQTETPTMRVTSGPVQGTVPDTVGMDEQAAALTLDDFGFRVRLRERTVKATNQKGIVVQQIPTGGTRRTGTTVTIVVGRLR